MATKLDCLSPSELYYDSEPQLRRHVRRIIKLDKIPGQDFGVRVACADNRMYIIAVAKNSAAWHAGLSPGDRIDMINKVPVTGRLSEIAVHDMLGDAERLKLALVDNGISFLPYTAQVMLTGGVLEDPTEYNLEPVVQPAADGQSISSISSKTSKRSSLSLRRLSRFGSFSRQSLAPLAQSLQLTFRKKVSSSSFTLGPTASTSSFQVQIA